MVKIPEDVNEWSRGLLVDLLDQGYDENETLEFKSVINEKTKRIPITGCAFANTKGGFMVFGVDNDRMKKISAEARLIGIEDSDQLKAQINNQFQTIKPNIPNENVIFRDSNIALPNNKVIVVVKILSSNKRPHQYNEIFYKRVANGNKPMEIEEIKNSILESAKNIAMISMLETEGSNLFDTLKALEAQYGDGQHKLALVNINLLKFQSFVHFLYNHAHLYDFEVQYSSYTLVSELERLRTNQDPFLMRIDSNTDLEKVGEIFTENLSTCIQELEKLEKVLGLTFKIPKNSLNEEIRNKIKQKMVESIKNAKPIDAATQLATSGNSQVKI